MTHLDTETPVPAPDEWPSLEYLRHPMTESMPGRAAERLHPEAWSRRPGGCWHAHHALTIEVNIGQKIQYQTEHELLILSRVWQGDWIRSQTDAQQRHYYYHYG